MEFILQLITELFGNSFIEEDIKEEKEQELVNDQIEVEESENIFGLLNFH